jgi:uncharacterized protein (DUF924 family)
MQLDPESVINFWFFEIGPDRWFEKSAALDASVRSQFQSFYEDARAGKLKKWQETPEGMLATLLLLDVFPRRMFAGTAKAYETDDEALELAREGIIKHFDDRIDRALKLLFYLPFAHSEHLSDQRLALFYIRERTKEPRWIEEAERRLDVIQRFGRFPHRNALLGRPSTPEEESFLKTEKPL